MWKCDMKVWCESMVWQTWHAEYFSMAHSIQFSWLLSRYESISVCFSSKEDATPLCTRSHATLSTERHYSALHTPDFSLWTIGGRLADHSPRCSTFAYPRGLVTFGNALVAWHCLMRLGEIVDYDSVELCDYRRTIHRPRVSFYLPMHKADSFFKGSTVVFEKRSSDLDPIHFFNIYLRLRDAPPTTIMALKFRMRPNPLMVHRPLPRIFPFERYRSPFIACTTLALR